MSEAFQNLQALVTENKLYLRQKLRMEEICLKIQTNPRCLGVLLKRHGFRNFAHFVNHFRVMEAARMMVSNEYEVYTIEAIAVMAGFANRQNFYNAFERIVGVKPAVYRTSKSRLQSLNNGIYEMGVLAQCDESEVNFVVLP